MGIQLKMTHVTVDGAGESFTFHRLPTSFKMKGSNRIAEEVVSGLHNPMHQWIGGQGVEFSLTVRLVDVPVEAKPIYTRYGLKNGQPVDQVNITAVDQALKWVRMNSRLDKQKHWGAPPVFWMQGLDDQLFGNCFVLVNDWEFDVNTQHIMNLGGSPDKMRLGDIMLSMNLKRVHSFQAPIPIGPGMR